MQAVCFQFKFWIILTLNVKDITDKNIQIYVLTFYLYFICIYFINFYILLFKCFKTFQHPLAMNMYSVFSSLKKQMTAPFPQPRVKISKH